MNFPEERLILFYHKLRSTYSNLSLSFNILKSEEDLIKVCKVIFILLVRKPYILVTPLRKHITLGLNENCLHLMSNSSCFLIAARLSHQCAYLGNVGRQNLYQTMCLISSITRIFLRD